MPILYKAARVIDDEATGQANATLRIAAKVTQTALAGKMGIDPAFLSNLEHGKRPWSNDWNTRYEKSLKRLSARHPLT